jgi:hypothetical protein
MRRDVAAASRIVRRINARRLGIRDLFTSSTGAIAVAPVEDAALVQHDRLPQPMLANVRRQRVELGPLHQREEIRQRVKFQAHAFAPFVSNVARVVRSPEPWLVIEIRVHRWPWLRVAVLRVDKSPSPLEEGIRISTIVAPMPYARTMMELRFQLRATVPRVTRHRAAPPLLSVDLWR